VTFTKAETVPSGLTDTLVLSPRKSNTDSLPTPHAVAISSAKATRMSSVCADSSSAYGKFTNSMVTLTLPSGKQSPEPAQAMQSSPRNEPGERIHLPCGQRLHSVFANSPFHVPAGQVAHVSAPVIAPYFPGGQRMHTVSLACPAAGWKVPSMQSVHVLLSFAPHTALQVPALQGLQLSCTELPISSLQVPGAQSMQCEAESDASCGLHLPEPHAVQTVELVAPDRFAQVPGEHAVHCERPSVAPQRPGGQLWQEPCDGEASCRLHVPTGHFMHTLASTAPLSLAQVPGGHAVHCKLLARPSAPPHRPGGQLWQEFCVGDPSWELHVPVGHLTHALTFTAPLLLLHVPGGHRVHSVDPSALHVPTLHVMQTVLSAAGYP